MSVENANHSSVHLDALWSQQLRYDFMVSGSYFSISAAESCHLAHHTCDRQQRREATHHLAFEIICRHLKVIKLIPMGVLQLGESRIDFASNKVFCGDMYHYVDVHWYPVSKATLFVLTEIAMTFLLCRYFHYPVTKCLWCIHSISTLCFASSSNHSST